MINVFLNKLCNRLPLNPFLQGKAGLGGTLSSDGNDIAAATAASATGSDDEIKKIFSGFK
jgi:hypothetical protein